MASIASNLWLQAMYPTVVIVLANSHRSFVETYRFSTVQVEGLQSPEERPVTLGHLSFAEVPAMITTEHNPGVFMKDEGFLSKEREDEPFGHVVTAHF